MRESFESVGVHTHTLIPSPPPPPPNTRARPAARPANLLSSTASRGSESSFRNDIKATGADARHPSTPLSSTLLSSSEISDSPPVISTLMQLLPHVTLRPEPSRRAKKRRWLEFEDTVDTDLKEEERALLLAFPADQCILYAENDGLRIFHPRKKQRPDSLRRHLENLHLDRFVEGEIVQYPRKVCGGRRFENLDAWLNHDHSKRISSVRISSHQFASVRISSWRRHSDRQHSTETSFQFSVFSFQFSVFSFQSSV